MNDALFLPALDGRPLSHDGFLAEAVAGLSQPEKTLPCKFLYDEEGSRLFNEICQLEEYYPTRTENQILRDNINEIASLIGSECRLVEFGSGTSIKTRHLLTHLPSVSGYIPIDIAGPQLLESAAQLAAEFPDLEINPLEADYSEISAIPNTKRKPRRTVAFFPGSTIGNFSPVAAVGFMRNIAFLCGKDGGLLIGVDRKKPRWILEPAYNDLKGVTARFNLGILARANRELGADFDLSAFHHRAPYNEAQGRIEMHLVSNRAQKVNLDSQEFSFAEGEYITTEHSYKYTLPGFAGLALKAGFELVRNWEDRHHLFSVLFLRVSGRQLGLKNEFGGFRWLDPPGLRGLLIREAGFMIVFHQVGKSFGNAVALRPIDLSIATNKTTVLIGLSGSGKSTILRLISGLIVPTTGWIEIDGKKLARDTISELRRRMGYVIQSGDLFPHLTARRNILLVAQELRLGMDEITARMEQLCVLTRFPKPLLDRYPVELSGGEQRRVSLTRALMLKPDILLLDEPLGALDPMVRASLLKDLKALFERTNTTVIVVTHNLVEAARLGDWTVLLNGGRIVQQGSFSELSSCPAEPFVSEFFRAQMDEVLS